MINAPAPPGRAGIEPATLRSARASAFDEVSDSSQLDLAVVQRACDAAVDVTLIGDPRQALYRLRGARPRAWSAPSSDSSPTLRPTNTTRYQLVAFAAAGNVVHDCAPGEAHSADR